MSRTAIFVLTLAVVSGGIGGLHTPMPYFAPTKDVVGCDASNDVGPPPSAVFNGRDIKTVSFADIRDYQQSLFELDNSNAAEQTLVSGKKGWAQAGIRICYLKEDDFNNKSGRLVGIASGQTGHGVAWMYEKNNWVWLDRWDGTNWRVFVIDMKTGTHRTELHVEKVPNRDQWPAVCTGFAMCWDTYTSNGKTYDRLLIAAISGGHFVAHLP